MANVGAVLSPGLSVHAEGSEALAGGAVAALAAATVLPVVSPLAQIWLLGRKSEEEIEDTVRLQEPVQVGHRACFCVCFCLCSQVPCPHAMLLCWHCLSSVEVRGTTMPGSRVVCPLLI